MLILFLAGCTNNAGNQEESRGIKAVSRNYSINADNAYNDLFLDSARMERFIREQQLNDTIAGMMRNFYNARNFQYAWFDSKGLTEQALAFRNLYDYTKDSGTKRKNLDYTLDKLAARQNLTVTPSNPVTAKAELMLTWRFINYTEDVYNDSRHISFVRNRFIPARKTDPMHMARLVLNEKDRAGINTAAYNLLKQHLKKYVNIAENGGWQQIPAIKKQYKKGQSDSVIVYIKKRLHVTGELPTADSMTLFDERLDSAVRALQASYGYKPDGIITPALVKQLNIPAEARVEQLLINMLRMRWIPDEPKGKLIVVNIPEFTMHVKEGNKDVFSMDIVVGKEGTNTVLFAGELNQVVFSPYWNIPESIVTNEILPAMEEDPDYLAKNDMEIVKEEKDIPVIRQLPGNKNQLGKVKFLFPNSFNIYFHDTPHKGIFEKDKRAYSHGCIRLSEPEKLAQYLLQDHPDWTPESIQEAMNSGEEKYVKVKDPVPVLIYYYTAWVDNTGTLQFREDIYNRDKQMAAKLFTGKHHFAREQLADVKGIMLKMPDARELLSNNRKQMR
jgi:Uncharacterized protein conserved in bacteria